MRLLRGKKLKIDFEFVIVAEVNDVVAAFAGTPVTTQALGADRTFFAGRLANYLYIDMDDCMRQALDTADEVLATL